MSMKRRLLVLLSLTVSLTMLAGPVSQGEALRKASQFLSSRGVTVPQMQLVKRQALSPSQGQQAAYYVFNLGADRGFVIASGDDRTPAIIGYSDRGTFDERQMPDNMREWMAEYERQMEWLAQHPDVQQSSVAKAPKQRISPLLTTVWNQGTPFNNQCPYDGSSRSVTGCVATAMAQVLNYHAQRTGLPTNVSQDIPGYTTKSNSISVSSFPTTKVFQWSNMIDNYKDSYTSSQGDAVATLMLACGTSVEMDYTANSSGASSYMVTTALVKYFGYDEALYYADRGDYSLATWTSLIYGELAAGRPVYYSGSSAGGGHAFVIDGFDGDELFHVNWGWGGSSNGYFLLSVLNPGDNSGIGASSTNDGYSYYQDAIINAVPAGTADVTAKGKQMWITGFTAADGVVSFGAWNPYEENMTFDYGIGDIDGAGHITPLIYDTSEELQYNYGYNNNITLSDYGLEPGTYHLVAISKTTDSDEWLSPSQTNPNNYIEAVIDASGNVTLTAHPVQNLVASDFTYTGSAIDVTITNNGEEFYGPFYFFYSTSEQMGDYSTSSGITLLSGESTKLSYEFAPETGGTYYIWIATDYEGTNVIGKGQVEVPATGDVATSSDVQLTCELSAKNVVSSGGLMGNNITMVISVQNDTDVTFKGNVQPTIYRCDGSHWDRVYYEWGTKVFPAHQTTVYEIETGELDTEGTYRLLMYFEGTTEWVYGPRYSFVPSVAVYAADGTVSITEATTSYTVPEGIVTVDLRGNTATTAITPNSNPNCLYILSDGAATPAGITTNIVKGAAAESITLTDTGLGFYTPVDFTAAQISYTRTFDKGFEPTDDSFGKNWSTVTLPFTVQTVTVGDESVSWMKNADDAAGNFWLMTFDDEADGIVSFNHSAEFKANTPYLIAVPDNRAEGHTDMTAKPVVFSAADAAVEASAKNVTAAELYKAVGTLLTAAVTEPMYVLNAEGTDFVAATAAVAPYRAYMTTTLASKTASKPELLIDGNISVTLTGFVKGDVNGDGDVGIADIVAITNVMADLTSDEATISRADVNADGTVGIADIVAVTNIMAGK